MKSILSRLLVLLKKIAHFIPTKIPVGIIEFHIWAQDIIDTYGFPDNDSVRWSIAVKILHMGETEAYKSKRYFFLAMHKAMSNQVVSQVIQDLKLKQQAQVQSAPQEPAPVAQTQTPQN